MRTDPVWRPWTSAASTMPSLPGTTWCTWTGRPAPQALASLLASEWGSRSHNVLDAAVGIGTQAIGLARLGFQVTGSDISPGAVHRAGDEAALRGIRLPCVIADVRALPVPSAAASAVPSLHLQLHVLVRRGKRVARDDADPRLLHPRPAAAQAGDQPDRREYHLLVDELLDAMQSRLASRAVHLTGLFPEEAVDVGIAAVRVSAAGDHEGFDPRGGVSERAAAALEEAPVFSLGIPSEEGRPLDGSELRPDADGVEVVDDRLGDDRSGIAEKVAGVEAVGVAGLGQELTSPCRVVRVARGLPEELEARGNDAPGEPGESQGLGPVDRRPVDGVVDGQTHAPIVPR